MAGLHVKTMFNFVRNCPTVFLSGEPLCILPAMDESGTNALFCSVTSQQGVLSS